jgi:hypothetical protein
VVALFPSTVVSRPSPACSGRHVVFSRSMLSTEEAPLDNPAYASLCGAHAWLAQVRGRARRYPADVAPFLALPSPPSAQDWRDAADLVAPGTYVAGRYGSAELPDGWQAVQAFDLVQMIEERVTGVDCAEAIPLGTADVPEMLELVAQTEPGPFLSRTIELGDYLGIRRRGALVAMAGERFHLDGWTEISARLHQTRPSWPGAGLSAHGRIDRGYQAAVRTPIPTRHEHPHGGDPALRGAWLSRAATRDAHCRDARGAPRRSDIGSRRTSNAVELDAVLATGLSANKRYNVARLRPWRVPSTPERTPGAVIQRSSVCYLTVRVPSIPAIRCPGTEQKNL